MEIKGWIYYNHGAIQTTPPHEDPNLEPIQNGQIWNMQGSPLLVRWTTDFDLGKETNWWYVIKDTPFDITKLKAKRRYEINKGKKNFTVREIEPIELAEELFFVTERAYTGWDKKYRPYIEKDSFIETVKEWSCYKVLGVFFTEDDTLCGYALLSKAGKCVDFKVMRIDPNYERFGANAACVAHILEMYEELLSSGGYINDGSRSINHETAFQDYLEKYFGFRKAYCKFYVAFSPKIKWFVNLLYPFRKILKKFDNNRKIHLVNLLFKMREIAKQNKKGEK